VAVSEIGEGGRGRKRGVRFPFDLTYLYAAIDDDIRDDGVASLEDTKEAKMKIGET